MRTILSLAVLTASYATSAVGQTERDLESHLHGAASLNVAVIDSSVIMEFNTPWNNLVGFEHAPHTDEQRALVDNALALLNDPSQLVVFDAGDCALDSVLLENSMSDEAHDEANGEEDEHEPSAKSDEHRHDDEHGDEHGEEQAHNEEHNHGDEHSESHDDEHGDEHDHEHADNESTHSTVMATYHYQCDDIDQLSSMQFPLFALWPGLVDLDVQLVGNSGQTMVELNSENRSLDVSRVK